jgi:enoyl-[acyl-carrier protein] reductase II
MTLALRTPLCDLLGIEVPVLQAGMGSIARSSLAAAVSEAGGLGVLGSQYLTPDELRAEIAAIRARTDRPFGVDVILPRLEGRDPEWETYAGDADEHVEIVLEEAVPVVVTGLGNPGPLVGEAHARGSKVLSLVGNVRQARRVSEAGVDGVIAQGYEAGGHTGVFATSVLVPQVVDAVDVSVVAAGGISDGRGLVAALALGAQAVWMGTRFIATVEADVHENYKRLIIDTEDDGTVVTRAHSGKPCRLIRNAFTEEWESRDVDIFPRQLLRVGRPASTVSRIDGDVVRGSVPAGQGSGLVKAIVPAGDLVRAIVDEARATFASIGTAR